MTTSADKVPGRGGPGLKPDSGSGRPVVAPTSPADFLTVLFAHGDGYVHLSTTKRQITAYPCPTVDRMADVIDGKDDVYISAAVAQTDTGSGKSGRIEDADMAELTALWVDLDRAGEPGHKGAGPFWSRDDMRTLLQSLPIHPTAIVDSGGGWWLWFRLTDPVKLNEDGTGELLLARWRRYWTDLADTMGRHIDGVWNPSRIARAPGSINTKEGVRRPAQVKSLFPERTYTAADLDAFLPAPEPPRAAHATTVHSGLGDRPGDTYNRQATVSTYEPPPPIHGPRPSSRP